MVPFYDKWESRVSPEDQPAVRSYRRKAQIWYYLLFLCPLVLCWISLLIWVLTTYQSASDQRLLGAAELKR